MNKIQDEELQSRREFFKNAAKATLPVLGAIVMANLPLNQTNAAPTGCDGCGYSCFGSCYTGCDVSCQGGCKGTCTGSCVNNGCAGACHYSCTGVSY